VLDAQQAIDIFVFSVRDGFVQVSAFVAVTVLLFSDIQYRTGGRLVTFLEENERLQPLAGGLLGLTPGCAPQIVFAGIYAEGGIPFSALTANAISQDGDALFPLLAIDMKAAIVASIYTTIPALIVGVLLHYFWPFAQFGFGVVG